MKVSIQQIPPQETEKVEIFCYKLTQSVQEIADFVKSRQGNLPAQKDGKLYEIPIAQLCYMEAVDNRVYLYCAHSVYESHQKLYELEGLLSSRHFIRILKSIVLNLMKVEAIKPALNGRYLACLKNGEQVVVSRKYVADLKKCLKGES